VLLRLGAPAVDAGQAGADRLPPPGRRINLEVEDADLHGVLRLFADASGLDFVIDEGVDRRITAELRDVPWNHALLAILDANGLAAAPLPGGRGVEVVAVR
jgi:type II secretory pathway component GspD/PulD (secretin)